MTNSSIQQHLFSPFNADQIELEIKANQKEFNFDIREYPIEFLVQQFDPEPSGNSDIFIPEYQRDDVWSDKQKSLFIESLLIGLPIPYIFVADVDEEDADGRVEIVDGAQRTRTIYQFKNDKLKLVNMERLPSLEGATFNDLPLSRQRRFNRTTIRLIELKNINEDGRRLMFERLNSGGSPLTEMEKRIGTEDGEFIKFIRELAASPEFTELAPLASNKFKRREHAEYVLRFFAYRENYLNFESSVTGFLNEYLDETSKYFNEQKKLQLQTYFFEMLAFVKKNFPYGFRKSKKSKSVSRIRFEATSVGTSLALAQNPALRSSNDIDSSWAYEDEIFLKMMRSDASNSRPKVRNRIEYVRNRLLGQQHELITE